MPEIPKTYNPAQWEESLYRKWEESGYFNPDKLPGIRKQAFCTIMPPPNANGRLHVGHGLDMTLKDLITRYKRMNGFRALFVPGADHAGFETQIVYEKKLEKEGRTRFDTDPKQLYQDILDFTLENKTAMENDIRRMGASCDWSRKRFTLDQNIAEEVGRTFKKMFDDGLVYRGSRSINWCSKHQTSLSEVETEFVEKNDPFYYFRYGPFVIGTARPETKFGDKYVVVNPFDDRYEEYEHGQQISLEWINGPVLATVIKDDAIDTEFGTGAMTITPWHDPIDFDIAQRHSLDSEPVIDFEGKLLPIAGEFSGMPIEEARAKIVEKLDKKGLLVRVDQKYAHKVKVCYKCATTIEPQIKEQWFVKMEPLAKMAMKAVREKKITFLPKHFERIFFHWMRNTIDWNISRQIVWGIPIPAKICDACHRGFPDLENTQKQCPHCHGALRADTDTFDTWFSSGQWPLLALGYPDSEDFKTYYPTDIMETGADLVFKWVPRMILFGMYLTEKEPFKTVYFHGMVNDEQNQKMSKSKGNVISPVEMSEQFGTDALRMSLILGNGPGNNIPLSKQKIESFRNFTNKLWNIGRYVLTQSSESVVAPQATSEADRWILKQLEKTVSIVRDHMEHFRFSLAGEALRDFTWNDFADWYVEIHKIEKNDAILRSVFEALLHLWHPFMPFVTEALWQQLSPRKDLLMIRKYPKTKERTTAETIAFPMILEIVKTIRNIRSAYRIDPARTTDITLVANDADHLSLAKENEALIRKLARVRTIHFENEKKGVQNAAYAAPENFALFVHLEGVLDIEQEKTRLQKEANRVIETIARLEELLKNEKFVNQAPQAIVEQNKQALDQAKEKAKEWEVRIRNLVSSR